MIIEIKIPSPGESISEVQIANWMVEQGSIVAKNQEIAEIESDKATLPLIAEEGGKISIQAEAGDTVRVGSVACTIDTSFAGESAIASSDSKPAASTQSAASQPAEKRSESVASKPVENTSSEYAAVKVSPVARKLMDEHQVDVDQIMQGLKRLGKKEVELALQPGNSNDSLPVEPSTQPGERLVDRNKMSSLRKKLSERLVSVKNETAMLTTFNEVDMSKVMALRKQYQQLFLEKHGVKLGFMSFFTKAASIALQLHPQVNAMIDGDEIVVHHYSDIGIAVQTPKGLMVPVIRNAESKSLAQLESNLLELAGKARAGRISLDDMAGGTFTITNGGVFGSLLSTPIINPPQSGILGMHNIVERPVAVNGKVEIRPMMYIALSYDHRVIDGKDSVGFLVKIKELIENPERMLISGKDPQAMLLGL